MRRRKAQASDPATLRDETAPPVERAAALSRLVSDQRREFERDIARLLTHPEPLLRGKAIIALAGRWNIRDYLSLAHRLLREDPDWLVRSNAACALSLYASPGQADEQERAAILRALAQSVQSDDDTRVKEAAYTAILDILGRPAAEHFYDVREFDPQRDVNWSLLAPYLGTAASEEG